MLPGYSVNHVPGLYRRGPNDACCCRAERPSAQREASGGPLATEARVRRTHSLGLWLLTDY